MYKANGHCHRNSSSINKKIKHDNRSTFYISQFFDRKLLFLSKLFITYERFLIRRKNL